ncbi:MAG: hypothetical protein KDB80_00360 [Planctomycetes bacterium]|nr:hypothetical protein [Planctomycetota bacterium]
MTDDAPLTDRQLQLMAFLDDEMSPEERARFQREINEDPELAIEVASYRNLVEVTASMRVMEPADHEMRRFWAKFYNRGEWRLGWILIFLGVSVLFGFGIYWLITHEAIPLPVKLAVLSVVAGALILLVNTLRLKIRTHRFDRYRGVLR